MAVLRLLLHSVHGSLVCYKICWYVLPGTRQLCSEQLPGGTIDLQTQPKQSAEAKVVNSQYIRNSMPKDDSFVDVILCAVAELR